MMLPATVFGGRTDVGAVREHNEDAIVVAPPLFAVADGMGGHAAGEVASALALAQLDVLRNRDGLGVDDVVVAIDAANAAILAHVSKHPETAGMGTTLSGVCMGQVGGAPHWFAFNVGDSRVYRYARGELVQVTIDHSEVQELVAAGRITADEARIHPSRNVVTRSLGVEPPPTADVWVLPAEPDETFLICSDGLPLEVLDEMIAGILGRVAEPQAAADALVAAAVAAGGRDNVSAVVVRVPESAVAAEAEISTGSRRSLGQVAT